MSPLDDALADYLKIRRALGYKLERAGKLLAQYLDHLDQRSERQVTIENDLAWATLPTGDANWWAFRMSVVRGFASYLHALDPAHQVPPKDLLPRTMRRMTPYLYSDQEIQARVRTRPDNYRPRARWVTFRPAQVDQYSGGAHKTTPGRHRSTAEGRRRAVGGPQDCWPPTRRFVVRELRCPGVYEGMAMAFSPGDRVLAETESTQRPPRRGVVKEVVHDDPRARYRIHWDDGHESVYTPADGALKPDASAVHSA